jgi:heptosyltransferase-2
MKILLVQTSFLGDTILSTPVIAAIKNLYPKDDLWVMTTPLSAELVGGDPRLSGVITFDKRKNDTGFRGIVRMSRKLRSMRFDRAYSLHRSYRTSILLWMARIPLRIGCSDAKGSFLYHKVKKRDFKKHDVIRNMSILEGETDLNPDRMQMRLFAPPAEKINKKIHACLPPSKTYAVIVPGSAWRTKMWHWKGFQEVAHYLTNQNVKVLLLGAQEDRQVSALVANGLPVIDLTGLTTISEAMYIIKHARLVVCNDSMSLHMASALQIPTAVIFCATSPSFGYGPWKNRAIVIEQKNLGCKPCRPHGSVKCPNGSEACMLGPRAEEVIEAVHQLLEIRTGDGKS